MNENRSKTPKSLTALNKNNKYNIKKIGENYTQSKSTNNIFNLNDENLNKEIELIINLWNDLGVTNDYREEYINLFQSLNEEEKELYLENEKRNLKRIRNSLIILIKEMRSREKNIQLLKKYEDIIKNNCTNEKQTNNNLIILDIVNIIKNIRLNSINIINDLVKVRELSSYSIQKGKYNLNDINPLYKIDENYILRMQSDLNFLKKSIISKFIDFSNGEIDPFLICCTPKINNKKNKEKITIPINDDLNDKIKQAKYYISQDLMFSNLYPDKNYLNLQKSNDLFFNYNQNNKKKTKKYIKNNKSLVENKFYSLRTKKNANYFNQSVSNIHNGKKKNMSRTLYKIKVKQGSKNYDLMFLNSKQDFYVNKDNTNLNNDINHNINCFYDNKNNNEIFEESNENDTESYLNAKVKKEELMSREEFLQKLNNIEKEEDDDNTFNFFIKGMKKEEEEKKSKKDERKKIKKIFDNGKRLNENKENSKEFIYESDN